ncbi:MAG: oligosaccharide flippase family protein [Actinomycetes bacterium]
MQTETAKEVTRRTAWITIGQGVHTASQILVATFLARWMSNSDWSKMAYLMSVYFAMLVVANLGLHHGMPYFISHLNARGQRQVVFRSMTALLVSGLVVAAVLYFASGALTKQWDGLAGLVALMGVVIAVELPSTICAMALVAMRRSLLSAIWEGSMGLVTLITVFGLFIQNKGLRAACIGLLIAGVIRSVTAVIALLWATRRDNSQNEVEESLTIPRIRDQITFALPLGATIIVSVLNRSLDKWLVAALYPARLGEYAIAAQELPIINILPVAGGAAIAVSLVHHLARGDHPTALKVWIEQSIRLTYVLVPAVAILIICSPEIIDLMFGRQYRSGAPILVIFTVILLHRVAEYGVVLRAAGRTRELLVASLVLLVANAFAASVLILIFGPIGAAIGTLIANVVAWLWVLRQVAVVLESSIKQVFPWKEWTQQIAIGLLCVTICVFIEALVDLTNVKSLIFKTSVVCLIFACSKPQVRRLFTPVSYISTRESSDCR